ncbi:phosphoglucosamine mutase [Marinitoga sp. 1135]|uniref:phosphoglucosamine mutase n=1 Tax=unclassified Marinitoga TaxID=2640159 RepID=UPI00158693D0|nr:MULTISPECIES: phosphoglucosamine mutase [unclassified Marinitoga]NUU96552.1 phosphoglucosamine mutase [Marinitoga sp. 1135]NUU98483.1 phosphoglucosamine mutase [Marinitoga sp. 1138]
MKRLFGTDGIRGLVNEELTVDLTYKVGNALGRMYAGKYEKLLIGRDTRNSGEMFEAALAAGALSAGLNVEFCGVITTPALAYLTKSEKSLGVMISASHNPANYNGIKVLAEGFKISDEDEVDIENIILEKHPDYVPYGEIGKMTSSHLKDKYTGYIVSLFEINNLNYKIAVDVGNGATGAVIDKIFGAFNIDYDLYFNEPDGLNINEKCGSTHPEVLAGIVKEKGYDLGILFDGDGDRCLFIDKNGKLIDGDKLMAINALKLKEKGRLSGNLVVATIMSNLGLEKFLEKHDISLMRTAVGDKYVLEEMLASKANLGGEQSGHIIFLDKATTGDGIITALETLETMLHYNKNIDELIKDIPEYPQLLKNVSVKDKKAVMRNKNLIEAIEKFSKLDNFRLVVRPSGTEHKIRIMAEGEDKKLVHDVVNELYAMIEEIEKY